MTSESDSDVKDFSLMSKSQREKIIIKGQLQQTAIVFHKTETRSFFHPLVIQINTSRR